MSRGWKFVLVAALLFLAVNVAGLWMALRDWEIGHAAAHVALALLSALVIGRAAARRVPVY